MMANEVELKLLIAQGDIERLLHHPVLRQLRVANCYRSNSSVSTMTPLIST